MSTSFIARHSKNNIGCIIQRKDAVFCLHVCVCGYCLYSGLLFLSLVLLLCPIVIIPPLLRT